jgi:hypothetical protein
MLAHQSLRALALVILITSFPFLLTAQSIGERFHEGCCLNREVLSRPTNVSQETIPKAILLEALKCATNNEFTVDPESLAKWLGDPQSLHVAYYYGDFIPSPGRPGLAIATYSPHGKRGWMFDLDRNGHKFDVGNFPELMKGRKAWRVGEINGGEWSYTRIWYLAQEIGSRPRQIISVSSVTNVKPESCTGIWMFRSSQPTHPSPNQ